MDVGKTVAGKRVPASGSHKDKRLGKNRVFLTKRALGGGLLISDTIHYKKIDSDE